MRLGVRNAKVYTTDDYLDSVDVANELLEDMKTDDPPCADDFHAQTDHAKCR